MLDPNMAVVLNNALTLAEVAGAYEKKANAVLASYRDGEKQARKGEAQHGSNRGHCLVS